VHFKLEFVNYKYVKELFRSNYCLQIVKILTSFRMSPLLLLQG